MQKRSFGEGLFCGDERLSARCEEKGEECIWEMAKVWRFRIAEPPYFEEPLKKKLERRRR